METIRHKGAVSSFFFIFFLILILLAGHHPVEAALLDNSGFESDFLDWSTDGFCRIGTGDTYQSSQNYYWTVHPYETRMAVIKPESYTNDFEPGAAALGLSLESRAFLTGVFPNMTSMTYIYTDITLNANESFTMAWNYVAYDYKPYNDASFCSFVNLTDSSDVPEVNGYNAEISILGATVLGTGIYSTGDYGSTGWQTVSFKAGSAGNYRLGFAVFNLTDYVNSPYLFVDKEPGTTLLNNVVFDPIAQDPNGPTPTIPEAPVLQGATQIESSSFDVNWSGPSNAAGYEIDVATDSEFNDMVESYNGLDVGKTTSCGVSGLDPVTTYYTRVRAYNVYGTSSSSIEMLATTDKLSQTITFPAISPVTYGDSDFDPGAVASSELTVTYESNNPTVAAIVDNKVHVVGPGIATIKAYQAGNDLYHPAVFQTQTLTVQPKALTIGGGLTADDKTYDGSAEATINGKNLILIGLVGSDEVVLNPAGSFASADAGADQDVILNTASSLSGPDSDNYTLDLTGAPVAQADILPRPITVEADPKSKGYGKLDPSLTWQMTSGSLVGVDAPVGSLARADGEDAGNYPIQMGNLDFGSNYTVTYVESSLTILPRPITVTADAQSKIYGNEDPSFTWQITSGILVGSDAPTGSLTRDEGENIGTTSILIGTLDFGDNYTVTYVGSTMTITPRSIAIEADALTKTYGDEDPSLTWMVTDGSLVGSDKPNGSMTRQPGEAVGAYAIQIGDLDFGSNYTVSFTGAELTISNRALVIQAVSTSKAYGDEDPDLTVQYHNLAPWDDETVIQNLAIDRKPGETVGKYAITPSGAIADNYTIAFLNGSLTIKKRSLTIAADPIEKSYGAADPELSYTITKGNLAAGDTLSGNLARAPGENAGSYAIMQNTLTASDNYAITFVEGSFEIVPYEKALMCGTIRNGTDPKNTGGISYVTDPEDGYGFAYWSDGTTLFSTQPELVNPVDGIEAYHSIIWPMGSNSDQQVVSMNKEVETSVFFLDGSVRLILPPHTDPEAVLSVTPLNEFAGKDSLPAGMTENKPFYCLLRSENLTGESIRLEIDLNEMDLEENEIPTLTLYRWEEEQTAWEKASIKSQGVDTDAGIFWAELNHFSTYGLFYAAEDVSKTGEQPEFPLWPVFLLGGTMLAVLFFRRKLNQSET